MGLAGDTLNGDPRAAARLLSLIEDGSPEAAREMKDIYRHTGNSYIIGITGPPGSGKSTLADQLIERYRAKNFRLGVLAVDPSSPFSGGAVLGDRIRMQRHATDSNVFIRSMANRNWPGGLSQATGDAVRVLEAYGCDPIIVETVGVGQTEVEVARLAYTTILVCTPAMGDKIQALKAGVIEIADIIVMNKADLPDAAHASKWIEMIVGMKCDAAWRVPVVSTVAQDGKGIEELAAAIEAHRRAMESAGILLRRKRETAKHQLRDIICRMLCERARARLPGDPELECYAEQLVLGSIDPYSLAEEVVRRLG